MRTNASFLIPALLVAQIAVAAPGFYVQDAGPQGLVSIEAESFKASEAREGHAWKSTTEPAGFSGTGAMVALPDSGANEDLDYDDAPFIDYEVQFLQTGRHYLWVRGWGADNGNSAHLDLDHRKLDAGEEIPFDEGGWGWSHESDDEDYAYFEIDTPGVHVISLCMREDGLIVDKIVLTTDPAYRPQGIGPLPTTDGGVIRFTTRELRALESATPEVLLRVELVSGGEGKYSVDYASAGGTAGANDYVLRPGTLTFGPGIRYRTIRLEIQQDGLDEDDETVRIRLSNPQGKNAQLGSTDTLTYTIVDPRPNIRFPRSGTGVTEQEGVVEVPLTLSAAYTKPVTVRLAHSGGSAAVDDFSLETTSVTIPAGATEGVLPVRVTMDQDADEPTETILLQLVSAENATLGVARSHTVFVCERSYSRLDGAHYFKYITGARWERYAKVGSYADAVILLGREDDAPGDGDQLIFWRGASYRPFLDLEAEQSFVDVVVPQNGDNAPPRFDRINRYSHIRILERSPARVIVQWRYIPDFEHPGLESWTEEYFTVYPGGVCVRAIKTGTETLAAYQDSSHTRVDELLLTDQGVCPLPRSWAKPVKWTGSAATLKHFTDLGFDRTRGCHVFQAKRGGVPGTIALEVASGGAHPAIVVQGWGDARASIQVDGQAFENARTGHTQRMENDDLVIWLGAEFKAGSRVVIQPEAGSPHKPSPPVVRAPVRDPYQSKIPLLPEGSTDPGPFGAYYTTLKYWTEWDEPWRVGDSADVVVQFDESPNRLVFWRGTTNVPHWVNEQNHWYENEFCERRGRDAGLDGLCEPMQDHESRYSNVRVIASHPARVIVHWRYSPSNPEYKHCFVDETGWGDYVDEYHFVYPDESCVRDTTLYTSGPNKFNEWQEVIPLVNPGKIPEDVLDMKALYIANARGATHVFDFTKGFPENTEFMDGYNILLVGMKGKSKPFAICESAGQWHDPISRPDDTRFNHYDDWPAWPEKYRRNDWERHPEHNYREFWRFLPSHSSLMHLDWDNYESDLDGPVMFLRKVLLTGMHKGTDVAALAPLSKYWENNPVARVSGYGFGDAVFDKSQKAYRIQRRISWIDEMVNRDDDKTVNGKGDRVKLEILASADSPLLNPCVVIENWPTDVRAKVTIDGVAVDSGSDFRQGIESHWADRQARHDLVVWLRYKAQKTVQLTIEMDE